MKNLYILLLISLLATGCVRADFENCPPTEPNTTIYFRLKDYSDNEIFPATVECAELFVYDGEGMMVSRSHISGSELNAFAGKRLWLAPGTYTVVVWANAIRSQIVVNENIHWSDSAYNHVMTAVPVDGVIDNGDPLYYAPKDNGTPLTVVVPEQGEAEVTVELRHAHVKLDITVEGYELLSRSDATGPLRMEVTDLTSRYGFTMNAHGERIGYRGHAIYADYGDGHGYNRLFNIPVFDRDTPTQIEITNSDGELIHPAIRISELLNDKIDLENLRYLPVTVRFYEDVGDPDTIRVGITVDLPGWGEGVVTPNV